jgi:multicomponent Na+:H+ antiporter subunit G
VILLLVLLVAAALFFHAVAALGVLRMPDFYTRLHAVAKAETLGVVLTTAALILSVGPTCWR